jgi:hypothetical protein
MGELLAKEAIAMQRGFKTQLYKPSPHLSAYGVPSILYFIAYFVYIY